MLVSRESGRSSEMTGLKFLPLGRMETKMKSDIEKKQANLYSSAIATKSKLPIVRRRIIELVVSALCRPCGLCCNSLALSR